MMVPDILDGESWTKEDFENAYRNWLISVTDDGDHSILLEILHDTEFEWDPSIPRDADRESDGRYVRLRFCEEIGIDARDSWMETPASFLEFLVGLSYSIEDEIMYDPDEDDRSYEWFWDMMENSGLYQYDNSFMVGGRSLAHQIAITAVYRIMNRNYDRDGSKGLFPLEHPQMDQRKVEIWYQANAYFIEKYFM